MKQKYNFFLYILSFLILGNLNAQRFQGSAVFGFNVSQIDGDELIGFDKGGLTGGFKLNYPLLKKSDLSLEMLYSQRGSRPKLFSADNNLTINLNYFELPLLIDYKDWWMPDDEFYKVGIEGGFSYSYLISVSSNNATVEDVNNFKKSDLAYLIGARLNFNKHWALNLRYTHGLFKIYERDGYYGFISYYLTARCEYHF